MRKLYLLLGLSVFLFSANAQVNVQIHMKQLLEDKKFVHQTVAQIDTGYFIKVSRLQYYLSGFKLIHDGGQVTLAPDAYFLVSPSRDSILDLGEFQNIGNIEQVEFSIGVDSAHNHLDPATWPAEHPLAPKDPSMHWGWQGGYRFIAFEGDVGISPDTLSDKFQIHGLDDKNYVPVLLNANEVVEGNVMSIPVTADYTLLLDSIDARGGLIKHGSQGIPRTLIHNLAYKVFSTEPSTGIVDPVAISKFSLAPNPSQGEIRLAFDLRQNENAELFIFDLQGRERFKKIIPASLNELSLDTDLPDGIYILCVKDDKQVIAFEKLIIQH